VQSTYRGWAVFRAVITAAVVANLLLAAMLWRRSKPFWLNLAARFILAATQLIFFQWTYPANQVTNNWTVMTTDWVTLRLQWELSHTANAIFTFVAFCCETLSVAFVKPT
jgi:hypothetical protein